MSRITRFENVLSCEYSDCTFYSFLPCYHVCVQWAGEATTEIVELGSNWMNVFVAFSAVDANVYLGATLRPIVDSGRLVNFVSDPSDAYLFALNNITTLFSPIYTAEDFGFNSGNLLTGWHCKCVL